MTNMEAIAQLIGASIIGPGVFHLDRPRSIKNPVICTECGKSFVPARADRKQCSKECWQKYLEKDGAHD